MAQSVAVSDILSRVRHLTDIETSDESSSIFTDAQLLDWLNLAHRNLYDIMCETAGEGYFAKTATVSGPAWALPSDFYRELGIDFAPYGVPQAARPFRFEDRNLNILIATIATPQYRVEDDALVWRPKDPPAPVTLWYIPTPPQLKLADGMSDTLGHVDVRNGWDEYLTYYVARRVREKQELPFDDMAASMAAAEMRVRRDAVRLTAWPETVADVRGHWDEVHYNS